MRATQFHELIEMALTPGARKHLMPVPRVPLQTVAADEVARVVADVAEGAPRRGRVDVVGPETVDAPCCCRSRCRARWAARCAAGP